MVVVGVRYVEKNKREGEERVGRFSPRDQVSTVEVLHTDTVSQGTMCAYAAGQGCLQTKTGGYDILKGETGMAFEHFVFWPSRRVVWAVGLGLA